MKKILTFFILLLCLPAYSQTGFFNSAKNVSIEYVDAPIRTALEQLMKQGEIKNYLISNDVEGFINLKLTDQPFETALKVVMRANAVPLLYKIENNILIVEKRKQVDFNNLRQPDIKLPEPQNQNNMYEVISLKYIDPLDLQFAFGNILYIRQFSRMINNTGMGMRNGMNGGMMGGGMTGGMLGGGMGGNSRN